MAEDIVDQTEQTEDLPAQAGIPNAPDGEAGRAEATAPPEGEGAGEEQQEQPEGSDAATALWDDTLPELAGSREQLTRDARETLLLKRLAAQPQSTPRTEDQAERPSSTTAADAEVPPVAELPTIDAQAQQAAIAEAFENQDPAALAKVFAEQRAYVVDLGRLVHGSLKDQDGAIDALGREMRMPNEMREALPNVRGANEADLKAALKLLTDGEVKTAESALKVAAFNRQSEITAAEEPKPTASEAATRKAKGLAASRLAGASVRGSEVARQTIPLTEQQVAADMRREDAANQQ